MGNCAEVRELIELLLGMVSGVGRGMGVLDGVHVPQMVGEVLGVFHSHWFEQCIFKQKCIQLVREKLTIFPSGQYTVGNVCSLAFRSKVRFDIKVGVYQKFAKM